MAASRRVRARSAVIFYSRVHEIRQRFLTALRCVGSYPDDTGAFSRRKRRVALIAACAFFASAGLTTGSVAAAPATRTATDSEIYTAPASVSAISGTSLACEPVTLSQVPGSIPMKVWKVRYASKDAAGKPIAVPVNLAVPTAAWTGGGTRPVIAFNPGTL